VAAARVLTGILPFHALYQIFALILLPKQNHVASRKVFIREAHKIQQKEVKKWLGLLKKLNRTLREMFNHRIKAPCLVVMGSEDHVFLKPAREYVARYSGVILETIDKCGHVCNIESPAEFNKKCLFFIQQLENKQLNTAQ
jgi:pimeloyl-ACP methyl ester carboxylesterase